jgi:sporulation protein YlmC with PRC-barrel domain
MNETRPTIPNSPTIALENLNDTGLILADRDGDIRGRKVIDPDGTEIGRVSDLFIDENERKVRMLEIRAGGFLGLAERHALLPVDAITSVNEHAVHVNETRERVAHSPAYDPSLIKAPTVESWEPFYGYYGLSPYWGNGYMYPDFPMAREDEQTIDHGALHTRD